MCKIIQPVYDCYLMALCTTANCWMVSCKSMTITCKTAVESAFTSPCRRQISGNTKARRSLLSTNGQSARREHTGLYFEAAGGTIFIGSPTAGANGDVTNFTLPGGLSVRFTGQEVCHADGRQLQRIGLVPQIEVRPTIEGIRENKDEVLERAIKFLKEGK